MKELAFGLLLAVYEEIFGRGLFWTMVVLAAVASVAYLYVLIRDCHLSARMFLLAQLCMPVGASVAVWYVLWFTKSRLANIGGPIDRVVLAGVAAAGAVGIAILVYTVQLLRRGKVSADQAKELT